MSLKSIRESYSKLLAVFNDTGVKLSESQKADIDTFVLAFESNMQKQRESAIRQTRLAVERKMEKEYRKVFESTLAAMSENARLAAKIQDKITQLNESKKIASKVNDYLDLYVESVLPKKTIVDYDRMQKLERIHESLKDTLLVNEEAVESKKAQLVESYKAKKSACETEVAKMQVKLNESMRKTQQMKRKVDSFKAAELLESKTKDLPTYEARKVKKALNGSTEEEIEENFNKTLKEVRKQAKAAEKDTECSIKSEVERILENDEDEISEGVVGAAVGAGIGACMGGPAGAMAGGAIGNAVSEEDEVEEDDMLRNRPHNGHRSVSEDDEKFETMEEVEFNSNGDVELDESDIIDGNLMKVWCMQSEEIH